MISATTLALVAAALPALAQDTNQQGWDAWCREQNDETSFCKFWQTPSLCRGGDQPCGTGDAPSVAPSPTTAAPATTASGTQSDQCDQYCISLNGEKSYCKYWQAEPVCVGGNQPCVTGQCTGSGPAPTGTPTSENCNAYCRDQNGPLSYCKNWLDAPLCLGNDASCAGSVCDNYTPSATPAPTVIVTPPANIADCDRYCQDVNGDATSYCKYWMPEGPVCRGNNQACSSCPTAGSTNAPTTGPTVAVEPASPNCEAMCEDLNGQESYCKNWLDAPLCRGGDQPCDQATCDAYTPAGTAGPSAAPAASTTAAPAGTTAAPATTAAAAATTAAPAP